MAILTTSETPGAEPVGNDSEEPPHKHLSTFSLFVLEFNMVE
jgi:hypothetical protein